jgi:hypothetical protein
MKPGPIVLFGSGETSDHGRRVFEMLFKGLRDSPRIALLETPAGFELNSAQVIERVAEFLRLRLQNYHPQVTAVPARRLGTSFSPADPHIAAPILHTDVIFMGPGSPTYAVRQLKDALAWQYVLARHRLGAALALASAAAIAVSFQSLPVYEIYKVGEELHWKPGLDLFGGYGLPLVFIPHWNNTDGGAELDTSRCFMGQERFAELMDLLPPDLTVVGLDEKTALVMDCCFGEGRVVGQGSVTLIHKGRRHVSAGGHAGTEGDGLDEVVGQRQKRGVETHVHVYADGESFPLSHMGVLRIPQEGEGLPAEVWQAALEAGRLEPQAKEPPAEVLALLEQRHAARNNRDWAGADDLRSKIETLGWIVEDDPGGSRLRRL